MTTEPEHIMGEFFTQLARLDAGEAVDTAPLRSMITAVGDQLDREAHAVPGGDDRDAIEQLRAFGAALSGAVDALDAGDPVAARAEWRTALHAAFDPTPGGN